MNEIVALFERTRLVLTSELALHESIAAMLCDAGHFYEREVRLGPGERIDFIVATDTGKVGIEVKIKGSKRDILRQLKRYAEHDQIDALVLASSIATGLPPEINGKPVARASLGRAWL